MSIFFGNGTVGNSAGKIKKGLASVGLALCCIAAQTAAAAAASENEIELKVNGSEAELELCFPQGAAEEIASMQISVSVKSSSENVYVEFIPDGGLASKITESRYQSDTGVLNIYLAGTRSLFSDSGMLTVGSVKISTDGSGSASAVVGVVEDSFKFVRGGELISPEGEIGYPSPVSLSTQGLTEAEHMAADPPAVDPPAVNPPAADPTAEAPSGTNTPSAELPTGSASDNTGSYRPSGNAFPVYVATGGDLWPTVSVVGDHGKQGQKNDGNDDTSGGELYANDNEQPTAQASTGENLNPADTSALQDVLTRADSYEQKDYSDNSYGGLNEAVNNANELLADPNATQDEIDGAVLDVENAIGMLALRNDIPSGAEGYGAHNDDGVEVGYYNAAYGGNAVENGEALPFGRDGNYTPGADGQGGGNAAQGENAVGSGSMLISENERLSENGGSIIAIGLAAVTAAAAAAVVVIRRPKKEKSTGGKHFKK